MKKLSLLLLTLCVSLATWAAGPTAAELQTLNPYAYNLSASWDVASSILNVSFTLNEHPNTNENYGGTGIQIFAVDPSDNNKLYYIYGVPGSVIIEHKNGKTDAEKYHYNLSIPINGFTWDGKEMLPTGKTLKLAVRVQGMNVRTEPTVVTDAIDNRPYSCHGVSVNNDSNSPDFGNIYVTEASEGQNVAGTWYWIYEKGCGRSVLEYTPRLYYNNKSYQKNPAFSPLWNKRSDGKTYRGVDMMEPHRVRVSEDGRIFVSSYNVFTSTDGNNNKPLVWELNRNTGEYTPLITFHKDNGYGHRVVGMAVKGKDSNLKVALCFLNITNGLLTCCEYNIGTSNSARYSANKTLFTYQLDNSIVTSCKDNNYYFYSDGLISIAYGVKDNTKIYLGYDYFWTAGTYNHVVGFNANGTQMFDKTSNNASGSDGYYGGGGITVYKDEISNRDVIVVGRYSAGGRFSRYKMNEASTAIESVTHTPVRTTYVVNDFAFDCANNMYIVSFLHGQADKDLGLPVPSDNGAGRLIAVAMPYGGTTTTMLPDNFTLTLSDPVPNILATDLRLEINNANEYTFSFNTNTQPEYAELRFYKSYESMKQSLNAVNADNFKGNETTGRDNENLVCYYPITTGLKQGKITVTLGGVGGIVENKRITNGKLPAGELYWSVYVKTRQSDAFAPIYEQSTTGEDAHNRLHATVNNYPETDGFGHIYAVNYYAEFDAKNGLMEYSFNPNGNSNDEQNDIKNFNRYKLVKNYLNPTGEKPKFTNQRRLVVAPDGKVYIADCGQSLAFDANADRPWMFQGGGVFVWNPNTQTGNELQISLFTTKDLNGTSTAVDMYNHNGQLKLYAANTYGEFDNHYSKGNLWKGKEYTEANQADVTIYGWNGFKEYILGTPENILLQETTGTVQRSLGMGDGNGNISIVATEKGVWMAQHRLNDVQYSIDAFKANNSKKPALPDNTENYILSFVPYGSNTRTWRSCIDKGINYSGSSYTQDGASELTQLTTSPLQSCPGAGLAYRKTTTGAEYLYIVNHQGNIVELQITSWSGTTPSIKYIKTYPGSGAKGTNDGGRTQGAITSMIFDYAGNLITTSGVNYIGQSQDIIVYTMPYDRTNAREIQAPNSCRMIPERLAYLDMSAQELELVINNHKGHGGCAIELFRPLQAGMFNTICLPFELDFANLPNEHPFKDAEVRAFTGATLEDVGGEKVLSLVFSDITKGEQKVMGANTPYLLQPVADIVGSVRFDYPVQLTSTIGGSEGQDYDNDKINDITFQGVIPITPLEATYADGTPLTLLLVADNRLAALTSNTNMLGFRAYFQLAKPLPPGTAAKIVGKKPVTTNTTIVVDGKKVNVEKYLREGRVYIRVGETLYTITGEKVIR